MESFKMPNDTLSFLERVQEYGLFGYLWLLIISMWAGTARYLSGLNGEKPSFWGWLTENVISGFAGILAAMLCQYYRMDFLLTAAITGIAAHNSTRALYIIGQVVKKNFPKNEVTSKPITEISPRQGVLCRKSTNEVKK